MLGSTRYHQLLLIRFFGYVALLSGLITFVLIIEPVVVQELKYQVDQLLAVKRVVAPTIITSQGLEQTTKDSQQEGFDSLLGIGAQTIVPVSTDYGIVIEKINANAKVIPNINPADEPEYAQALTSGVVAAAGSTEPGQVGNLFIFSHSADAPWTIVRLNAVFYLLGKLAPNDRIILFYQGKRYDYLVYDKQIASSSDITFLTNRYDKPVLTLQTCDPPGTLANRLIIRAKLQGS